MEKVLLNATLCYLVRGEGEVLLARKSRHIGEGLWNGYGGGIEAGESPEEAALRELEQESGMRGSKADLQKVAVVDFHNTKTDGGVFTCRVHTYLLSKWEGEPVETEEMLEPTWFPITALPLSQMMLADTSWVPRALAGEHIYAEAWYGPKQQTLLRDVEITSLPEGM